MSAYLNGGKATLVQAWSRQLVIYVRVFSQGVDIVSAYLNGGKAILSGTSMAAPHVAGVAAKLMGGIYNNTGEVRNPQDVEDQLVEE